MLNRRHFLISSGSILALSACDKKEKIESDFLTDALDLIEKRPSLDLHAHPGRTFIREAKNLSASVRAFTMSGTHETKVLNDMHEAGISAAVFSGVSDFQVLALQDGGLAASRPFKEGEAYQSYQTQIANLEKLNEMEITSPILTPKDIMTAKTNNKIGVLIGIEGGDFLEGHKSRVERAYQDGVRAICVMHYRTNELGDIMTAPPVHNGLTNAGKKIITAMNKAGMLIDLAHSSEKTAFDILRTTTQPVMCSHTHINSDKMTHPRFISLDLAKEIAMTGGVLGAWPAGIGITNISGFTDRIFELIDAVGIDHVGLGTDMDANYKPVWKNYRQFPSVVALLLERGLTRQEVAKIIGGNGIRLFENVSVD
ncbi:MAG: dipeptidase [bacterium]